MLLETRRRCRSEKITLPELVRCDSAKLPFLSDSIDAIHAGAAMHCWPDIQQSLNEIHRVLRPNGAFFATTFIRGSRLLKDQARSQGFSLFESEQELYSYLSKAGFSMETGQSNIRREGISCVVIKCVKGPPNVRLSE